MPVNLVEVLVVLAVVAAVAAVAAGAVRADMDDPVSSLPQSGVPAGDLVAHDVSAVRFSLGFRGYRMSEVDEVLDRVATELSRRDAELDALRCELVERGSTTPVSGRAGDHRPGWAAPEDG